MNGDASDGARSRRPDNDVELFIAGRDTYYEFEINAFGIWRDLGR